MNNLTYTKEECPNCNFIFNAGYEDDDYRSCPSCMSQFKSKMPSVSMSSYRPQQTPTYYGSNNMYYKDNCPALMSDGRFITYHNSTNDLTDAIRRLNNIDSSNKLREFLQNNAEKIMNSERNFINGQNRCNTNRACSNGFYDLHTKYQNDWSNAPLPYNA